MLALLAAGVLFVACANVAGLLASRAPMRARELALRLAIGAGRARIVRQLITESLFNRRRGRTRRRRRRIRWRAAVPPVSIPTELPIAVSFRLDQRALAISVAVAVISAVLFGLAPALQAARADLTSAMKGNDSAGFGRRRRGRGLLVGGQVAIAVGTPRGRHFHLSRLSAASWHWSRIPARSPTRDVVRPKPHRLWPRGNRDVLSTSARSNRTRCRRQSPDRGIVRPDRRRLRTGHSRAGRIRLSAGQ